MAKYESNVKQVNAPQSAVYSKLSDLNNLATIKERIGDPDIQERMAQSGQVPADKLEMIREKIEQMEFTQDSVSINAAPLGKIAIDIVEREPEKCIKFQSAQSPIGFKIWIQILPTSETTSKIRVTIDADVNIFMKAMVDKPLKEGVEKFAEMLAMIPY